MAREFEMMDIGLMSYYLGIEVKQRGEGIIISQEGYAKEILKMLEMANCKLMNTPVECGVKLSKQRDGEKIEVFNLYKTGNSFWYWTYFKHVGYCDSDWVGDINVWKNTIGFVFFMGNMAFTWISKTQPIVTFFTYEAE
ncbi:uncharacterized protein LOC111371638 [Olea europaea var. sylvestris]|uniref:uncharacterized protein LOC111371638 n=1 Tax=Olea europaea var. sylvestris TaxID=158386 RepID=UPI000C1CEF3B|nr:uncharacterized protein LOC111371638 [Olea europaea var. sylvestris]